MIIDPHARSALALAWEAVRDDRNVLVGNLNAAAIAGRPASSAFRDLCFSLLLTRGFSVLEDALEELRLQGTFTSRRPGLKQMMDASRQRIPWCDSALVDRGRERRNESVHDRIRLPHPECRDYLAAIERQLFRWSIVDCERPELWRCWS